MRVYSWCVVTWKDKFVFSVLLQPSWLPSFSPPARDVLRKRAAHALSLRVLARGASQNEQRVVARGSFGEGAALCGSSQP